MPNYYHHEDYVSEKDMRGWNKDDKAEQREINWDIRLEYYADRLNAKQVVKMLEEWIDRYEFPYGGVPTLTMRKYAQMAIEMERRMMDAWRPNQSKKEISNRSPFYNSHKISRMIETYERMN
jgi:hypothetical protein